MLANLFTAVGITLAILVCWFVIPIIIAVVSFVLISIVVLGLVYVVYQVLQADTT